MFAFLSLPSPLHPAVVHFPIVLILLGSVVAIVTVFVQRGQRPAIAAALLALGAVGVIAAVQTGERDSKRAGETPAVEAALEQHEEWAERTQVAAIIVALLAIGAVGATRWPVVARTLGIATAAGALVATWCVVETGHHGGQLVYRHGAGINLTAAPADGGTAGQAAGKNKKHQQDHDD